MDRFHEYILLNAVLGDEPVDGDISGLPNTMASILSLLVHGWVPVSVIEDNIAGSSQVESNTTRSGTRDETKDPGIVIEALDYRLAQLGLGATI